MVLRLGSLVVALALMAVLATSMRTRLHAKTHDSPANPQNLLRQAGMIVERTHQITGVYAGVSASADSPLRLVSGDATGYCLQLTWLSRPYHLRGPAGQSAPGAC